MPIEHIGIGVPDVEAARTYFDELMPMVGFQPCFDNGYCPEDFNGAQLFLYPSEVVEDYSRRGVGLQHLAFLVTSRTEVDQIHQWVQQRGDEVLRPPQEYPEYGPDCYATYFLDPHGFMIEVVCHEPVRSP